VRAVGVTLHHVPFLARHHMYMVDYSPHTCLLAGHTHLQHALFFSHTVCAGHTQKCTAQQPQLQQSACAQPPHTRAVQAAHQLKTECTPCTITLHQLHQGTDRVQRVPGFSTANTSRSSLTATTYPLKTARLSVTAEPVHPVPCRAEHTHCHNFPPLGQNCKPKLPQDSPDSQTRADGLVCQAGDNVYVALQSCKQLQSQHGRLADMRICCTGNARSEASLATALKQLCCC